MARTWNWKQQRERRAFLALEDGTVLRGHSVGGKTNAIGEVVFNTGMTGYQEILTDPSYSGQIVTMTYPEIGNTGINAEDEESRDVFANGFIVHEMTEPSNWRCERPLAEYLRGHDIPALAGVDTRALTSRLRVHGTLKGFVCVDGAVTEEDAVAQARAWPGLDNQDYASRVTVGAPYDWKSDGKAKSWGSSTDLPDVDLHVLAWDYGIKWNILRSLRENGIGVRVVSAETPAEEILSMSPDGVFLSNGPGDPAAVTYAIENARRLVGKLPMMGICLGHQLLGLALGGKTFRLKFGHHGCNHPIYNHHNL
jgi:carbamoyl-phosphate synthase small subunit